ncbi:MFS transporter [Streptomyces sp. TRM72054]|uniref:MFS transporter n=1 Tax=Streptomyces sp. TRM72054 TaxID=2870562 RepID=UPI001C8BDBC9|nr:MFS transporter [Streptomyces sp. TRM72054]MBX9392713.1 MFS transporter [Streptomyces sp. TRM72054]
MNRRLALTSSVAGAVVVALDGTVLTIAQPTLQRDLDASYAQVQWTSTGYLIAVAALLVFAGRLGDRYGHRRLFALGMLGFGATSAGIGGAADVGWVIGLRVAQGVFGALLQPAALGMLRASFPADRLRRPLAVRTAAIGLAAAAGPVVGGALVHSFGWRAVFFLNVVPALVLGVLALRGSGQEQRRSAVRLDLPGALLLALTLACLVHALVTRTPSTWVVAALAAVAFAGHERRTAHPLIPADVIGSAPVAAALGVLTAASAALSGTLFVGTYVLQRALGLDPLRSTLLSLPLAVLMIAAAPVCAVLLRRTGARRTTVAAMTVLAVGILVLVPAARPLPLGVGFALLGAGFGTVMVAATHVVVRQAPVASAGVAGGLQQTAMNVGPVLGVAMATTLMGAGRAPLLALAGVAVAGAVAALLLPGRAGTKTASRAHPDHPADPLRIPARR